MIETRTLAVVGMSALLAACASSSPNYIPGGGGQTSRPPAQTAPPPMRPADPVPAVSTPSFRAPQVMRAAGLEGVIGASSGQLERRFGPARLKVTEGDALKLQFSGEPCVLDVYLYPLRPGGTPSATHVEARRASDGRPVDRASCAQALRRS